MIDLTDIFRDALKSRDNWTSARTEELLEALKRALPGSSIDWEPPNENWGAVLLDKEVPAHVCALAPIAFVKSAFSTRLSSILDSFEVYTIFYQKIGDTSYRIDKSILKQLVNRDLSLFDYDNISLNEIWFATVT
jgi:hypothetical protein